MLSDVESLAHLGSTFVSNCNLTEAQNAFEKAYKISCNLDGHTNQACAFNLGAIYVALGNTKDGLELLKKAKDFNVDDASQQIDADLDYNLGLAYEKLNDLDCALSHFSECNERYRVDGNVKMHADTFCKLAGVLSKMHRHDEACRALSSAARLYRLLNNNLKLASTLSGRAAVMFLTGDKPATILACDECVMCLDIADHNHTTYALAYNDVALIYTQCLQYQQAAHNFEKALAISQQFGDDSQTAVVLQNLGAIYNFMGHFKQSVPHHEAAASQYSKLKNRSLQGHCFSNLAFAYSQLGEFDNAFDALLHALLAATDSGDKNAEWQALEGLGVVSFNQGNLSRAVSYFKKALTTLAACGGNVTSQERIVSKLTSALQRQIASEARSPDIIPQPAHSYQRVVSSQMLSRSPRHGVLQSSDQYHIHTDVSDVPNDDPRHSRHRGMRPGSTKFKTVPRGLCHDRIDAAILDESSSFLSRGSTLTSVSARSSSQLASRASTLTSSSASMDASIRDKKLVSSPTDTSSTSEPTTSVTRDSSSDSDSNNVFRRFRTKIRQRKHSELDYSEELSTRKLTPCIDDEIISSSNQEVTSRQKENATSVTSGVAADTHYAALDTRPFSRLASPKMYTRRLLPETKRQSLLKPILQRGNSTPEDNTDTNDNADEEREKERVLEEMMRLQDQFKAEGGEDLSDLYDGVMPHIRREVSFNDTQGTKELQEDEIQPTENGACAPRLPSSGPPITPPSTYLIPQYPDRIKPLDTAILTHTYAIINTSDSERPRRERASPKQYLEDDTFQASGTYESLHPPPSTCGETDGVFRLREGSSRRDSVAVPLLQDTELMKTNRAEREKYLYEVQMEQFQRQRQETKEKRRSRMCLLM